MRNHVKATVGTVPALPLDMSNNTRTEIANIDALYTALRANFDAGRISMGFFLDASQDLQTRRLALALGK